MKRIGKPAVLLAVAAAMQGCILIPVGNNDSSDPFFFDPDNSGQSADFLEVGHYQPNSTMPPSTSRSCSVDGQMGRVGSACWFFPIMQVY